MDLYFIIFICDIGNWFFRLKTPLFWNCVDNFQELIQQMANVHYTENMTEEQLDAMAGSETLRYQATSFGITRNNKVH